MGSSRLPGKTLQQIEGEPLLGLVVKRFSLCKEVDEVCVATTESSKDDPIIRWCEENEVACFRGSEEDVLDRVVKAALCRGADAIVQMGADSAYLDFALIDDLVRTYKQAGYDFVCNTLQLTWPLGIYGHVIRVSTLEQVNRRSDLSRQQREHVVPYLWEHPEKFRLLNITAPEAFHHPELRLTIDFPTDLEQARTVYRHFGHHRFTTADILQLYAAKPEIFERTKRLRQRMAPHLKTTNSG